MAVSSADIQRLRRMVNELNDETYNNTDLATYLSAWPLVDKNGKSTGDANWIEAYDLHAAAADIWEEKAAKLQDKHDFTADGATFHSSQMYENAMKQARHHRASQKAKVRIMKPVRAVGTYFPEYENPIFDEDEEAEWIDSIE